MAERLNPFTDNLVITFLRVLKRDAPAEESAQRRDYYDIEDERSVTVFNSREKYEMLEQLSASGHKLFRWIIYHMPDNKRSVKLDEVKLCELFGCTDRHLLRMRTELIRYTIIAKREANEYWVNPKFFAPGNRIKIYPECAVRRDTIREKK